MAQQLINVSTPNSGLGDTLRTSQVKANSNFTELYANKVDKIIGKVLSDTNYTQTEKDQLAALVLAGANVQSDMTEGNPLDPAFIKNKFTKTSDFINDGDGVQAFVPDVGAVGTYGRSAGQWIQIANPVPNILDGIIGVTVGFNVGQVSFTLPVSGSKCVDVHLAHSKQYKITPYNASLVNRWSQTGDIVTLTKTTVLNNYIYIEYI